MVPIAKSAPIRPGCSCVSWRPNVNSRSSVSDPIPGVPRTRRPTYPAVRLNSTPRGDVPSRAPRCLERSPARLRECSRSRARHQRSRGFARFLLVTESEGVPTGRRGWPRRGTRRTALDWLTVDRKTTRRSPVRDAGRHYADVLSVPSALRGRTRLLERRVQADWQTRHEWSRRIARVSDRVGAMMALPPRALSATTVLRTRPVGARRHPRCRVAR